MATVNKDFKIKSGLIVEGANGTINGYDILTKNPADDQHIIDLIGGEATPLNVPDSVVKRDGTGNFAASIITADIIGNVTGDLTGNADTATALETSRTIELTGDVTGSVSFDGTSNVQISTTIGSGFATDSEVATAKQEAIDAAELYTDGRETAITTAYQAYADQAELDAVATAAADATTKANAAQANAEDYADGVALTAENNAKSYADGLAGNYDAAGSAAQALSDANDYTDTAVANLVDGAPALLDTLNELAAAIADNPNYATDVANLVAGKQDALTAGANIDITNDVISVTGLDTNDVAEGTNLYFTDARAQAALSGLYDPAGSAAQAQSAAESFATTAANNAQSAAEATAAADATTKANAAQSAAETYALGLVNGLDTDDIEEGINNLYFTDARAQAAVAGDITSAINGLDTDDIEEGNSNLYFTDARAQSAVANDIASAVAAGDGTATPEYLAVNLADVAKQVAAQISVPTASAVTAFSWGKAAYKSAEFLVKIAYGTHTEVSKVVLTLDTSDNISITEYAMVGTNGSLGSVSADVSGSDVRLRVTTDNNNSTVTVVGTLLV